MGDEESLMKTLGITIGYIFFSSPAPCEGQGKSESDQ
jgi:hypothetical protein